MARRNGSRTRPQTSGRVKKSVINHKSFKLKISHRRTQLPKPKTKTSK